MLKNCAALFRRIGANFSPGRRCFQTVIIVRVPPFPESVNEGEVKWERKEGESVAKGDVVCEIETEKTAIPVPSPEDGALVARLAGEGSSVKAGQELFKLGLTKEAGVKPPQAGPETTVRRPEIRVKMSSTRQTIARRLKESQNTAAMLTTFNEIDMSALLAFRQAHSKAFYDRHGVKLGLMSAFLKGSAYALREQPVVNAAIIGDEIVHREYVDVSVAVAGPRGLVVPVVRNVDSMNYADIEKAISALVQKVKAGKLSMEEMRGGTFTVSNGGVFGSLMGTPIINPPQSAILGMHATIERPVALKGQLAIRPMMYVALTYDHRLIDGREAVLFLRKIKAAVEDPKIMLLAI